MRRPAIRKSRTRLTTEPALPVFHGSVWLHELRSKVFGNTRLLRVWLPQEYDGWGAIRYPVLYLNDGQNLFDPATAFAGVHWQAGETAARLIRENKIRPLIIVGIDNTGKNRAREYVPYKSREMKLLNVRGREYPEFLRGEVMPFIEGRYAVLQGAENTGIGGSSLGGLISLYTQLAAPGVFGQLLVESPSLFVGNRRIVGECRKAESWPSRMYLGVGTRETGDAQKDRKIVSDVLEVAGILRDHGLTEGRLMVKVGEGATHTEAAWAQRLPEALTFLFPARLSELDPSAPSTPSQAGRRL